MDHRGAFLIHFYINLLTVGLFIQVQIFVNCDTSHKHYQHCESRPGGVHDLDCYSRQKITGTKKWRCEWKPGVGTSQNTYTLRIQQGNNPKTKSNISALNAEISIRNRNLSVLVMENPHLKNCTKTIFEGMLKNLYRCGPPLRSTFMWHSGNLNISVEWLEPEKTIIHGYNVRYKAMGDLQWKLFETHENRGKLNSSQVYVAQVKCSNNKKCSQCPWSNPYIIPPELNTEPTLISLEVVDSPFTKGMRLVTFSWKTMENERPDRYNVRIQKASRELPTNDTISTTHTAMTLYLSCSAYFITIRAINNVSVSPPLSQTITSCEHGTGMEAANLNVTLHSNKSFTVYWDARVLENYVCYSVELSHRGHKPTSFSFYEKVQSNKRILLEEPLEPYKRYTLFLHTRQYKDTCNLKSINSSERTYRSMHFYLMEGPPKSAPTNISYFNVTPTSLVLQWSPIPEHDVRGFLQGYVICYKQYKRPHTAEKTVTVDAELTNHKIEELTPGTHYQVKIAGFTRAGTGVWSIPDSFNTNEQVYEKDSLVILVFVITSALLIVACPLLKRTKVIIWPNIPNPEYSNAIQKVEKFCDMELLESLETFKMEEWDTHSLKILQETANLLSLSVVFAAENQEDSQEICSEQIQEDAHDNISDNSTNTELVGGGNSQPAFTCGYTTLEMFQDAVKSQRSPADGNGGD